MKNKKYLYKQLLTLKKKDLEQLCSIFNITIQKKRYNKDKLVTKLLGGADTPKSHYYSFDRLDCCIENLFCEKCVAMIKALGNDNFEPFNLCDKCRQKYRGVLFHYIDMVDSIRSFINGAIPIKKVESSVLSIKVLKVTESINTCLEQYKKENESSCIFFLEANYFNNLIIEVDPIFNRVKNFITLYFPVKGTEERVAEFWHKIGKLIFDELIDAFKSRVEYIIDRIREAMIEYLSANFVHFVLTKKKKKKKMTV